MRTTSNQHDLLDPLTGFYEADGKSPPEMASVTGSDVPQPYRRLLVHDSDMTPTLEEYFRSSLALKLLRFECGPTVCRREVALMADDGERVAAFGAIRIHLGPLPEAARGAVCRGRQPLGAILRDHEVPHDSLPDAYFRVVADELLAGVLAARVGQILWGRRNELTSDRGERIARVIEVLPPRLTDDHG